MEVSFWMDRWEKREIGFHLDEANPILVKHFNQLSLEKGSRVFVPLCGKTNDIGWLLSQGYRVVGAELSEQAIGELFAELGEKPEISECGKVNRYSAKNIDIFVGNFFDLTGEILGPVDAIYDRAALVALPKEMRERYTRRLIEITGKVPQLLLCFEYDQKLMEGPPFSIVSEEVHAHYRDSYRLVLLERIDLPGGLKGKYPAIESVWMLT